MAKRRQPKAHKGFIVGESEAEALARAGMPREHPLYPKVLYAVALQHLKATLRAAAIAAAEKRHRTRGMLTRAEAQRTARSKYEPRFRELVASGLKGRDAAKRIAAMIARDRTVTIKPKAETIRGWR